MLLNYVDRGSFNAGTAPARRTLTLQRGWRATVAFFWVYAPAQLLADGWHRFDIRIVLAASVAL